MFSFLSVDYPIQIDNSRKAFEISCFRLNIEDIFWLSTVNIGVAQ